MKALARSHFWGSYLDQDVEALAIQYEACKITAPMPAHHPWQYPSTPWERVHIDYGKWNKRDFLVTVDTFSKWPEVKVVSSTMTQKTVTVLSEIFATHGFPRVFISCQTMGLSLRPHILSFYIIHYKSPPYHPSNGLAENMVKNYLKTLQPQYPHIPQYISEYTPYTC